MSLSDQVQCLATYAFLAAAMQIKHGPACLSDVLYANIQATVKNIVFTLARMQNIDPNLQLHVLLEGTDHLEGLFGDCCTQDHARNFDLEQLSKKLGVVALINIVME